jgi:hypothetical protein
MIPQGRLSGLGLLFARDVESGQDQHVRRRDRDDEGKVTATFAERAAPPVSRRLESVSSDTALSPQETLAGLEQARDRASARVDQLENQQRGAAEAAALASGVVADLERRQIGGEKIAAATRRQAEDALARARAEAGQPWAEKIAGAQAARRDAHQRVQAYIGEHLDQLVAAEAAEGEVVTAKLNDLAQAIVETFAERETSAGRIAALVSTVARIEPGDISRSRAEALVQAARALIDGGGEEPPRLLRDPRQPRLGVAAPAEAA